MKSVVMIAPLMCIIVSLFMTGACAMEELPEWEPGYQWAFKTHLDTRMQDPGSSDRIDMIIDDDAPDYRCLGVESRRLTRGDMVEYEVYRLTYQGTVTGEGTADVDLFDTEIPVELRNGTQTGETWVDTETLGTVFNSRFITGDLWAYYLFSWRNVGTIEIAFTEEYQPARDCYRFPADVGDQWHESVTLFFYGRYLVTYDIGSGPETQEDVFDDQLVFDLDYHIVSLETYKTWETLRTEGTDPGWDGLLLARYSAEALNYAYFSMTNIDLSEQGILIRELRTDLIDFDLTPLPTPTPSPTPDPDRSGMTLHLNAGMYSAGDSFRLARTLVNAGQAILVDEYIVLDVYGSYWFWPEWSQSAMSKQRALDETTIYPDELILGFVWPEVDGSANDLRFWGALLDHANQSLFGDYDMVSWGYR